MQRNIEHISHLTLPQFKSFKLSFIISMLMLLCVSVGVAPHAEAKKEKEDKIEVKILQNREYNECMFKDEVIIRVKYRLRTLDNGALTAELSNDGVNFYEATSVDIERGKGKIIMSFDAGECATDMRVVMK